MERSALLPPRLRYLEPVRKYLTALGPEEVNENTDLTMIRKVVRKRVKGLPAEQARAALNEDGAELDIWLSAHLRGNESLGFLLPFLAMDAADTLLQEPAEMPPEREVSMDLQEDAKISKENGCWSVKWRKKLLSLYPSDSEKMESEIARFRSEAKRRPMLDGDGIELVDVHFASVRGIKRTYKQTWPAPSKQVDYALEVPGGYVLATLQSLTGDAHFDESEVEVQLHTLRAISHQTKGA